MCVPLDRSCMFLSDEFHNDNTEHCNVCKVSPFFKRLIGKFISTKNSSSIHLVIFHYVPYTLHTKEKKSWKIVAVFFLIYDKKFFKCLVYRPFMLYVPLDSIIESVIAVGGVLLWVSSVCWDTQ